MHGRFYRPMTKWLQEMVKLIFLIFFIEEKARIFRYWLHLDFLSTGQKTIAGKAYCEYENMRLILTQSVAFA